MPRPVFTMLIALGLAGCGAAAASTLAPHSVAETKAKIDAMDMPKDMVAVFAIYGGVSARRRDTTAGLSWDIEQDGVALGRYDVSIADAGNGSSLVSDTYVPRDAGKPSGDHIDASTMAAELFPTVMRAQIDRAVTGRAPLSTTEFKAFTDAHIANHSAEGEVVTRRLMSLIGE